MFIYHLPIQTIEKRNQFYYTPDASGLIGQENYNPVYKWVFSSDFINGIKAGKVGFGAMVSILSWSAAK
jgi:hypothetical protein